MIFTNFKDVSVDGKKLNPVPVLKLTTGNDVCSPSNTVLQNVIKEAKANHFKLILPDGSII
jgi:hypothetical protein